VIRWFGTNTDIDEAREIREQLQRANTNLDQYAYSASHDLREPLRNVTVYSQLLERRYGQVLDRQGAEFLGSITDGAARMETLVTDLLTYADTGKPAQVPLELVDSGAVLNDVLSGMRAFSSQFAEFAKNTRLRPDRIFTKPRDYDQFMLLGGIVKDLLRPCR
jgi:light-regulated signal transduction histidine kinase (bacteriophytochrome)